MLRARIVLQAKQNYNRYGDLGGFPVFFCRRTFLAAHYCALEEISAWAFLISGNRNTYFGQFDSNLVRENSRTGVFYVV